MSARFHRTAPLVLVLAAALALPSAAQQPLVFDAPVVVTGTDARFVKTLDLDGDGWMDAMGWWQSTAGGGTTWPTAKMRGWLNDRQGRLVQAWETTFSLGPNSIEAHDAAATGDLDLDGMDDFVFSNDNEVRIYMSNGNAPPTQFNVYFAPTLIQGVALADFDADGDLEFACNVSGTLEIHSIDLATGALPLMSSYATGYTYEGRLIAAELTGDYQTDLLIGGSHIFPVVGGAIQAPIVHPQPWSYDPTASLRHEVGDIDGDVDRDIVTFRVQTGATAVYRVLRRTGPSTFVAELPQTGGPARRLFDVDGDGDRDGVCCGGGGPGGPSNNAVSTFKIAFNDGTGAFAPSVEIPSLGSTAIAGVEDLDHDGNLDLVAGRCVYYAPEPIAGSPFDPVGTRVQNERTLPDYDWDGDSDVELTVDGVRANLGDGTEVARTHNLPSAPSSLQRFGQGMPGDFDGDGVVDLLVLLGTPDAPVGLELLRNVGGGAFESKGIVAGPSGLLAPTSGGPKPYPTLLEDSLAVDVDGDGDQDLVRRTRSGYAWSSLWSSWLRNDGPAGFVFVSDFPGYVILHARDLNGDSLPDLLGVTEFNFGYSTHVLRVAAGLGGGTFAPWTVINVSGAGSRAYPPGDQVAVADLDEDGDLDIAMAAVYSIGSGSVARVLLNNGDGSFLQDSSLYIDLTYGTTVPGAAAVTDLNQDGLADLVFGPVKYSGNAAAIYLRKADNSGWEPVILQTMFQQIPGSSYWNTVLTARDPDGDRDTDMVTNQIVKNRLYEMPDAGSRVQLQDGVPGLGGIVPTLGAVGPFRVGKEDVLRLRGARPGATGVLLERYVNSTPAPFGGAMHLASRFVGITPISASGSAADPAGSGSWSTAWIVPAIDAGRTKSYEVRFVDPAGTNGESRSNTLVLAFGP